MARNRENGYSEQPFAGCVCLALWKRITLAVIAVTLLVGFSGCALDDLLAPFAGDIDLRMFLYRATKDRLLNEGQTLNDFANAHN